MGRLFRTVMLVTLSLGLSACGLGAGNAQPSSSTSGDLLQRGLAAQQSNRPEDAIKLYYEALARDPNNPNVNKFAFYNLGFIEHSRNHPIAAEAWYRLALVNDENMPEALLNLAIIRESAGDFTEEATLLRRLLAAQPNNANGHWHLGVALRGLGQTAEANNEFATAQRLDPRLTPPPAGTARPSPTR